MNAIFATHLAAHIVMFALMTFGIVFFARLVQVPRAFVLPMVIVFSALGAFGLNNRAFDIWAMLGFGLLGVLLELAKVPLAPFVVGLVLARSPKPSFARTHGFGRQPHAPDRTADGLRDADPVGSPFFAWPFIRSFRKEETSRTTRETGTN